MTKAKGGALLKILGTLVAIFLVLVIFSNKFLTVTEYEIKSNTLPTSFDGFRIAFISDLHSTAFGKENKGLLKKLKKQNPDIVLLGGDMVNSTDTDFSVFYSLLDGLGKNYDTYFVVGNHEQALGDEKVNLFCQTVESKGVTVLDNEKAVIEKNGEFIDLYGMWFNLRFYADRSPDADTENQYYFDTDTMTEILGESELSFNLLLTHNPVYFDTYEKWGADLTLSGHIHGGMIRIPFLGGVYSPEKTYFPLYDSGVFNINNSKMVVSRGLGNGNLGFRLFNCPELVTVVLKK